MARTPWLRSRLIPYAVRSLRARGHDLGPVLRRFGIDQASEAPEIELPMERHHALIDELAQIAGDPLLGVHLARERPAGSHGIIEYFWRSAPNVEAGLTEIVRNGRLIDDLAEWIWERKPTSAVFGLRVRCHPEGMGRHSNEFFVQTILGELRKLTGAGGRARRVLFEHGPGAAAVDHAAELDADRVEWRAGLTGIEFDDDVLRRPLATADPALLESLRQHARSELMRGAALGTARPSDGVKRVGEILRLSLQDGVPALGKLAASVGASARSLQRMLEREGTTLRALVERVRMEEAERLLIADRLEIAEVAQRLGFADTSSFARAFRRWSGEPPAAFRARRARR